MTAACIGFSCLLIASVPTRPALNAMADLAYQLQPKCHESKVLRKCYLGVRFGARAGWLGDQAQLAGARDGLGAVLDVELGEDVVDVALDSVERQVEPG